MATEFNRRFVHLTVGQVVKPEAQSSPCQDVNQEVRDVNLGLLWQQHD